MDPTDVMNAGQPNAGQEANGNEEAMLIEEFAQFWFESELIDDILDEVGED